MAGEVPNDARCLACGYALRGLPRPVCPECGRAFDLSDPGTYRDQSAMPKWRRWANPPRAWHVGCTLAATAALLHDYTVPTGPLSSLGGFSCLLIPAMVLFLGGLLLNYGVRAWASQADRWRAERDRGSKPQRQIVRWLALPLCLLAIASASMWHWPLFLRFHLSRAALEDAARAYLIAQRTSRDPGWIGVYHFDHVLQQDVGVGFLMTTGFCQVSGFFYSPNDTPPTTEVLWSRRIAPNWFLFEWNF